MNKYKAQLRIPANERFGYVEVETEGTVKEVIKAYFSFIDEMNEEFNRRNADEISRKEEKKDEKEGEFSSEAKEEVPPEINIDE